MASSAAAAAAANAAARARSCSNRMGDLSFEPTEEAPSSEADEIVAGPRDGILADECSEELGVPGGSGEAAGATVRGATARATAAGAGSGGGGGLIIAAAVLDDAWLTASIIDLSPGIWLPS